MIEYGFHYAFYYPVSIKGFNPPIAIVAVYMKGNKMATILETKSKKEAFKAFSLEQAQRIESIFNAQYIRDKENENG